MASADLRSMWSQKVPGSVYDLTSPRDDSFVAVASGVSSGRKSKDLTGEVLVFDRAGVLIWKYESSSIVGCIDTCADGSLIVAAIGREVRAFSSRGSPLWAHETRSGVSSLECAAKGETVVVAASNRVDVLNRNGKVRWSKKMGGEVVDVAVSRSARLIVVSSWEWREDRPKAGTPVRGLFSVFDGSGLLLWRHEVRLAPEILEFMRMPIAIASDDATLAFGCSSPDGQLHVLRKDGHRLWTDPGYSDVLSIAASDDCSVIAIGSDDFQVVAFNGPGGQTWSRGTGGDPIHVAAVDFALAVAPDGAVIAGSAGDERMYLFDRAGESMAVTPMQGYVKSIRFSAGGFALTTGTKNGTVARFEASGLPS